MNKNELIKFLNYLEKSELFIDDLSDESKENLALNFIHSAQGENSNVSDNEKSKELNICPHCGVNVTNPNFSCCQAYENDHPEIFNG